MTWVKGQSGNPAGRPKGARHKLSEAVIKEIADDWAKHGLEVVQHVRETKPDVYLQVISRLMPTDVQIDIDTRRSIREFSSEELAQLLQRDEKIVSGEVIARQTPDLPVSRPQKDD